MKIKKFKKELEIPAKRINFLFKQFASNCKYKDLNGHCSYNDSNYILANNKLGISFNNNRCCYAHCPFTIKIIK